MIHDASHAAPRDDYRSQTGYLVLLTDRRRCSVLTWKSTTQKRRVGSSMAAECYAAQPAWRHALYMRRLIGGIIPQCLHLPVVCATDNDDLDKIAKIRKRTIPKDRSLTICLHILREMIDLDDLVVHFVEGKCNPADALTKPLMDLTKLYNLTQGFAKNIGEDFDPLAPKRSQ